MGVRQRRARAHSKTHIVAFAIAGFFAFLALLGATLLISLTVMVNNWLEDLPDYQSADAYLVPEPTTLYAADGSVIAEYYLQNRRTIDINEVSPFVLKATVDTEDIRFYQHDGVDPVGIARAVLVQLTGGSEGASTITQQLVRNTVLSEEQFDYSIRRKVREAYIAIQMEKTYTKDQILMMYLNTIYYGDSCYGIQAASIDYFNKNASDLTLAEAALLCGLPQAPSAYNPFENPDLAVRRRNIVLDRMFTAGDITQEEFDAAVATPLELNHGAFPDSIGRYPYFSDHVRSLLLEDFDYNTILQGGLQVYTTLDPSWQAAAEEAVHERLDYLGEPDLQSALVAIDNSNGYVKAMVGGRDYNVSQFNLATQARRQPGSSFKGITTVAALQLGMNPDIYINGNSPITLLDNWEVQNYGGVSYGYITFSTALAVSCNTVFCQIAETIGADKIVAAAKSLGIDVDLPAYPSITLGTVGVPPIQMAEAYSTIATGGIHREPCCVTRIEDRNGNVVYEHTDEPAQTIDPGIAAVATEMLQGVCRSGGGADVLQWEFTANAPVAGKTGTTQEARDLWFVGFTPQITCAVWTGYIEEQTVYYWGSYGHPYSSSVMEFAGFLNRVLADVEWQDFPEPDTWPTYRDNSEWEFSATQTYVNTYGWNWYDDTTTDDSTESTEDGTETTDEWTEYDGTESTDEWTEYDWSTEEDTSGDESW